MSIYYYDCSIYRMCDYASHILMVINFKILQSKYFKINNHQNISRAFNILHYIQTFCSNMEFATKIGSFQKKF